MVARRSEPKLPAESALPAVHALHLAEVCRLWGVPAETLFADSGVDPAGLTDPSARIGLPLVERLVDRARALTGEPALGFFLGMQMRISAHGHLGFAAMTASSIREALELATRFAPTRTNALELRLELHGGQASLVIDERCPLGSARDTIVFALLIGIWQIGCALTARELTGSAEVAFDEPDYFRRFAELAPGEVRFGQPQHRLVFDAAQLELPLVMADPAALILAREQCERELDAAGAGLVNRVRKLLPLEPAGFRSLDEVAQALHVSPRTLKRHLASHGSSYSALLEGLRHDRAVELLRAGELSVEQIAARLGYSDAANFTRAFRRWTGATPQSLRRAATQP